jgi:molecular chaperone DnaK (HSP70)
MQVPDEIKEDKSPETRPEKAPDNSAMAPVKQAQAEAASKKTATPPSHESNVAAADQETASGKTQTDKPQAGPVKRLLKSIGMEMPSNRYRVFLGQGVIPPVSEKKHFVARLKNLDNVSITILEGDEDKADTNVYVGEVGLTNIKLRKDNRAEVEIEFSLSENGALTVKLIDRIGETESMARFVLPQFSQEALCGTELSGIPVEQLAGKIDLLEQQMQLLKGELSVRRERG